MPYSGTKEEINRKQREYYKKNQAKIIIKTTNWSKQNKEKIKKCRQKRYGKNRNAVLERQREYNFIKTFIKHGCCINCFETNPFLIESHHVFKNNELTIDLCVKCHSLIHINKKRTPKVFIFFN